MPRKRSNEPGRVALSWRRIKRRLIGESKLIGKERAFRTTGIGVCAEGRGEGASQAAIPGKHGRLESLFGKYKDWPNTLRLGDHGERVMIPLLVTP